MSEALPAALQCPSCGSTNAAPIPLSLIQARYYKCGNCVVTFRAPPHHDDRPDIERFNRGWSVRPEGKSKT
jgi:hypothetical protein